MASKLNKMSYNKMERRKVRKKDFDNMVKALLKITPPKNWKEPREK